MISRMRETGMELAIVEAQASFDSSLWSAMAFLFVCRRDTRPVVSGGPLRCLRGSEAH